MGLLDRLGGAARELFGSPARQRERAEPRFAVQNAITTSLELSAWIRNSDGLTESGESVTANTATKLATVARCVRLLQQSMASLPLVLYRKGPGRRKTPAIDDPLYLLLHDQPNEWQTSHQWRALMQRDVELRGNAYSLKVRAVGGRIQELIRLHPDRVRPEQDKATLAISYIYTRPDGAQITYRRDDILHIWFESDDGVRGLSPIAVNREVIGDALAMQRHGSRFFSNGAKPLGAIQMREGARMAPDDQGRFRDDWDSTYAGGNNANRTLLLPYGLEYKPISISMVDSQYIEGRKFSVADVARIFGIPAHMAGDLDHATFTNIEHQRIEFVQDAIVGRAHGWEQCLQRDLLDNDPSFEIRFNIDGLLRGDNKSRQEALQIQRRNGIINANEWRDEEDFNPREDEGGDVYIVEGNMQPNDGKEAERLEKAGQRAPPPAPVSVRKTLTTRRDGNGALVADITEVSE